MLRIATKLKINRSFQPAVHAAVARAIETVAEDCLTEANRTVPIETGTLMRSGHVTRVGELEAAVGYDTPYAVVQHEDSSLHHDPGRRDHWLERTVEENRALYTAHIAKAVERATEL
jgi:hypothetical protein